MKKVDLKEKKTVPKWARLKENETARMTESMMVALKVSNSD